MKISDYKTHILTVLSVPGTFLKVKPAKSQEDFMDQVYPRVDHLWYRHVSFASSMCFDSQLPVSLLSVHLLSSAASCSVQRDGLPLLIVNQLMRRLTWNKVSSTAAVQ